MLAQRPNWFDRTFSEQSRIIIIATLVGALAGAATFALKWAIALIGHIIAPHINEMRGNYLFLIFPTIGVFLATIYQTIIKENLAHGTSQLKQRLSAGKFTMRLNEIFSPLIGCIFTIGFGGSAGSEGPSAYSGAALGSNAAKWFHLSPYATQILFGAGAAAGIAGIFRAPIGGVMFAMEILCIEFTLTGIIAVICASLSAFVISYALSGFNWTLSLIHPLTFDYHLLGWVTLLGFVCGIYSIYYAYTQRLGSKLMTCIPNRWVRALACGGGLSLIIFLWPTMFGEGYSVVSNVINGKNATLLSYSPFMGFSDHTWVLIICLATILIIKGAVVGATNSGGGVAGNFAPTVFAGALTGFLFATFTNYFFGTNLNVEDFALVGTAAVMAGSLRAPLMAIFIAAEISACYNHIIPFITVAIISYLIVVIYDRIFRKS